MAKREARQVKTRLIINLYEPKQGDPLTHRPEIIFDGELISRKTLEDIHFHTIKALGRYKAERAAALKAETETKTGENDEGKEEGDVS